MMSARSFFVVLGSSTLAAVAACTVPLHPVHDAGSDAGPRDLGTDAYNGCPPGMVNLNGMMSDGCEYACTMTSTDDEPDSTFTDANCDGIDGEVAHAVFVSPAGSDTNPGTMAMPVLTIAHAIEIAGPTGNDVYADRGTYAESVVMIDGVSIYGGYDRTVTRAGSLPGYWDRRADAITTIEGGTTAVEATAITMGVVLDRLTIHAADATTPGGASIGVWAHGSTGTLRISASTIVAGMGGDGTAGMDGTTGAAGGPGMPGAPGTSSCGHPGGAGGAGGTTATGQMGFMSAGGGVGGSGGTASGCVPGGMGGPGGMGTPGTAGSPGSGGNGLGSFSAAGVWSPSDGMPGMDGTDGTGGGGGGGGGSGGILLGGTCSRLPGGVGGGGGGGGCHGTAGQEGTGGGASFGVLAANAVVVVQNDDITSGAGGAGGGGGRGGAGGGGGGAGTGAPGTGPGGTGGMGGPGGAGGRGSAGGGGGGGPSVCIAHVGTGSITNMGSVLHMGAGGMGGMGLGTAGTTGISEAMHEF